MEADVDGFRCRLDHDKQICEIVDAVIPFSCIPASVRSGSFSVCALSDSMFIECIKRGIPIPSFITALCDGSPHALESITRLQFPATITAIGNRRGLGLFTNCTWLKKVVFAPGSCLRMIRGFSGCISLKRIQFPPSIERIDGFCDCPRLAVVVVSLCSRLTHIDGFHSCDRLPLFEIPRSLLLLNGFNRSPVVTELKFQENSKLRFLDGFERCSKLARIEVPASVEEIGQSKGGRAFSVCPMLREVVFGHGSRCRNALLMQGKCPLLSRIEIPAGFDVNAFSYPMKWLDRVWIRRTGEWTFFTRMHDGCCLLSTPPISVTRIPRTVSDERETYTVSAISNSLLGFCNARSIEIPSFIRGVYPASFRGNDDVVEIKIPPAVTSVEGFFDFRCLRTLVFLPCSCLRELRGFDSCRELVRIEIPENVEIVEGFNDCTALSEVVFAGKSRAVHIVGFQNCRVGFEGIPETIKRMDVNRRTFLSYEDEAYLKQARRRVHLAAVQPPAKPPKRRTRGSDSDDDWRWISDSEQLLGWSD
jgi:hypothetical protein